MFVDVLVCMEPRCEAAKTIVVHKYPMGPRQGITRTTKGRNDIALRGGRLFVNVLVCIELRCEAAKTVILVGQAVVRLVHKYPIIVATKGLMDTLIQQVAASLPVPNKAHVRGDLTAGIVFFPTTSIQL